MKTQKLPDFSVELKNECYSIKLECSDFAGLSLFLMHLCNSLTDSMNNNKEHGYNYIAASDKALHDSIRESYNQLQAKYKKYPYV